MQKILYILYEYPQLSETYIQVEIEALMSQYDIYVITLHDANLPTTSPVDFKKMNNIDEIIAFGKIFNPDYIHTHWIDRQLFVVSKVAKALNIPYTIRSHSFDVLWREGSLIERTRWIVRNIYFKQIINDPLCKGVLAFPFAKELLIRSGIKEKKITVSYPVIDYQRFYSNAPNGDKVINLGACLPKKSFESYIAFSKTLPELQFDLYAIGYNKEKIRLENTRQGTPVKMCDEVEYHQMPAVYKEYQWLVYTVNPKLAKVGWPLAAAEAMASGVGVCLPNIRPDMKEYIEDAGVLYSSLEELNEIISKPVPEKMRQRGFEVAKKCDIYQQLHLLTDLWN